MTEHSWLFPRIRNFRKIIPFLLWGGLLGSLFGIITDQITYTISSEYFTQYKFNQFSYLDFGLPQRVYAGIVGIMAGGSGGLILSWFPARIRFASNNIETARQDVFKSLFTIILFAMGGFILGACIGLIHVYGFGITSFMGWEDILNKRQLPAFAIVGYMHNFGYLSAFAGLILSIYKIRKLTKSFTN